MCAGLKAHFPLGELVRANRQFLLSFCNSFLLVTADFSKTKKIVASREQIRLVENGIKIKYRLSIQSLCIWRMVKYFTCSVLASGAWLFLWKSIQSILPFMHKSMQGKGESENILNILKYFCFTKNIYLHFMQNMLNSIVDYEFTSIIFQIGIFTCDPNAVAYVINGETECFCATGFYGDGETCTGILKRIPWSRFWMTMTFRYNNDHN